MCHVIGFRRVLATSLVGVLATFGSACTGPSVTESEPVVTVAELERTAELGLPDGASEVTIERLESGEGLRAVFSLPSAELAAWCQEQALGASTPSSAGLDDELRDRFAIAADVPDDDLRRCLGSAPSDPEVQREVLATGTAGETASVHLVVEVWPTR